MVTSPGDEHTALIARFYDAFARRDHRAMAACYDADATFTDPVFPALRGAEVAAMWQMLCERGTDLRIEASEIRADGAQGSARWEARYTFSATARPVHNVVRASFGFSGGRITRHVDQFDFYRWARQALGARGVLLGWTPLVRGAVRRQAARSLAAFIRRTAKDA